MEPFWGVGGGEDAKYTSYYMSPPRTWKGERKERGEGEEKTARDTRTAKRQPKAPSLRTATNKLPKEGGSCCCCCVCVVITAGPEVVVVVPAAVFVVDGHLVWQVWLRRVVKTAAALSVYWVRV